jgi:hypothetical protein
MANDLPISSSAKEAAQSHWDGQLERFPAAVAASCYASPYAARGRIERHLRFDVFKRLHVGPLGRHGRLVGSESGRGGELRIVAAGQRIPRPTGLAAACDQVRRRAPGRVRRDLHVRQVQGSA